MTDTIKIEVELKKCWVRGNENEIWIKRWIILNNGRCISDIEHDKVPDITDFTGISKWSFITFDDPNIKQMTQAEIEKELGYKIKIVGE